MLIVGSHKKKVDELRVVRVSDTAETGHRAGEGGRIVRGVRDLKPADAVDRKIALAVPPAGLRRAVTECGGAAADHASDVDKLDAVLASRTPESIATPSMFAVRRRPHDQPAGGIVVVRRR